MADLIVVELEGETVVDVVLIEVEWVRVASCVFEHPLLVGVEELAGAKVLLIYSVQSFVVILVEQPPA